MWTTGFIARSRPAFQGWPYSHNGAAFASRPMVADRPTTALPGCQLDQEGR